MIDPIKPISSIPSLNPASIISSAGRSTETSFGNMVESAVRSVEETRTNAHQAIDKLLRGEEGELHNVIMTTQRAEMQFEFVLQIRNKVVQAYQEIMRMQI